MTNSPSAKEVMDLMKPSLPYAAAAWVLLLLATILIAWLLPFLMPLASWILLGLASVLVTVLFYLLTFPIQESISFFQTTTGKVTLQLVGPVVVFAGLLYFGRGYIPNTPFVELSGDVRDSDDNLVEGVTVLGMSNPAVTGPNGKFTLRIPLNPDDIYDIVAYDNNTNTSLNSHRHVDDPRNVNINNYPSENTVVTVENLTDQDGQPIDNAQISFKAVVEPEVGVYNAKKNQLTMKMKEHWYWYIVRDKNGDEIYRYMFRPSPGRPIDLPNTLPLREKKP